MQKSPVFIPQGSLPRSENELFENSSFFLQNRGALPLPTQVRARQSKIDLSARPPPVRYPELGLLVKYGREITIAEGQCLWAIRRLLQFSKIPVPEIYAWKHEADETFLYMELVEGLTLHQAWDELSEAGKDRVCEQLATAVQALRLLKQEFSTEFVGHIGGQALLEVNFCGRPIPRGPFPSVKEFHDGFSSSIFSMITGRRLEPNEPDPFWEYRASLPDSSPITFTHGDLHPLNIIIRLDEEDNPSVVSIVDWHQSGWLPAYWEYCKAVITVDDTGEWATKYLPKVLGPDWIDSKAVGGWSFYMNCLGC